MDCLLIICQSINLSNIIYSFAFFLCSVFFCAIFLHFLLLTIFFLHLLSKVICSESLLCSEVHQWFHEFRFLLVRGKNLYDFLSFYILHASVVATKKTEILYSTIFFILFVLIYNIHFYRLDLWQLLIFASFLVFCTKQREKTFSLGFFNSTIEKIFVRSLFPRLFMSHLW